MTALRTWVHGSQSPGRPPYWGKVCSEALLPHHLPAHPHTLFFALPCSIKVSLQFPPLFQKQRGSHCCLRKQQSGPTRTVTRPGRRRPWLIKSECGPSSGVGTLGWPDSCRRGGPLLGEVEKIAAWHLAFRLGCPRGRIQMGPLLGRT